MLIPSSDDEPFYHPGCRLLPDTMLLDDGHVVHRETVRTDAGADIGIVVRFGSSGFRPGTQFHDGKQGWFCAYVVMKDEDFDRISGKLSYRCRYPELDVPGGTSYFSRIPPFDEDGSGPETTVIGWDYDHDEPYEKDATLDSVIGDAKEAVGYLSGLLELPS